MDLAGAAALIVLSSPLLVALMIKLSDGGKVLFWQDRVGRHRRIFAFPKLRSMVPNADKIVHLVAEDNHHGNILR